MRKLILSISICFSFTSVALAQDSTGASCPDITSAVTELAKRCCPYLDDSTDKGTSRVKVSKCLKKASTSLKAVQEFLPGGEASVDTIKAALKEVRSSCFEAFPAKREKGKKKGKKKDKNKESNSSTENETTPEVPSGLTCDQCVQGCLQVGQQQNLPLTEDLCRSQCAAGNDQFGIPAGTC